MKVPKFKDFIVHEDEDYVIINKPPHMATLDDRANDYNILSLAKNYNESLTPCHRLDKDTSGILVLSKSEEAYKNMAIQFEKRQVEKLYHAVSDGIHEIEPIMIEAPLGNQVRGKVKIDFSGGKPSATKIRTAQIYKFHTLFECKPVTGRTHQIRAHLSHIGAPIAGDLTYGGESVFLSKIKRKFNLKKGTEEQPLIKRFALHARSITFNNLKGEKVVYEAGYPKDLTVLIKQLEKNVV